MWVKSRARAPSYMLTSLRDSDRGALRRDGFQSPASETQSPRRGLLECPTDALMFSLFIRGCACHPWDTFLAVTTPPCAMRQRSVKTLASSLQAAAALTTLFAYQTDVRAEDAAQQVLFRARVTKVTPDQPSRIHWRWGGEGLGGQPVRGEITRFLPSTPPGPDAALTAPAASCMFA